MRKGLIKGISLIVCFGILLAFTPVLNSSPRVDKGKFEMQWRAFLRILSWFFTPNTWFTFDSPSKNAKSPFSYNYPATKSMKIVGDTPSDDPYPPGGGNNDD